MDPQDIPPDNVGEADTAMDEETKPVEGSNVEDVPLTDDGGVVKRIITAGSGWETPEEGDEVTVHYTGTLTNGTKFDSSVDRGDPFTFTLGQGEVIKSWDIGVASMKKGEKALLIAKPEYAYGAKGSPPTIPPDSTLHFEVELISWKSTNDISNDGGVIKSIKQSADGWEKPSARDIATYAYSVRVKGSDKVVAESPEGGASAAVSTAGPLLAFPVALPTMKKGEVAELNITPQYGFPSGQLPPNVSNDDRLEVTLELKDWQTVEDVTEDGAIVKKTLVKSSEWKKPALGATVTAHVTGRLSDGGVFEDQDLTFVTDEEQVPEGLELAIIKMKKGETAEVSIPARYAFGDKGSEARPGGSTSVPAGADVVYTIQLTELQNPKSSYEMSDAEKVEAAAAAKEKGNARFKAGKWTAALVKYKAAVDFTKSDKDFSSEQRAAAREVSKAAHLNSAACQLKLDRPRDALTSANEVLNKESTNVKALYRAGQAHLALGEYVEAEAVIKKGLSEDPSNSGLRSLHKEYKQKAAASNKRDKAMFSKMFRPSKDTAAAPASAPQTQAGSPAAAEQAAQAAEGLTSHPVATAATDQDGSADVNSTNGPGAAPMDQS